MLTNGHMALPIQVGLFPANPWYPQLLYCNQEYKAQVVSGMSLLWRELTPMAVCMRATITGTPMVALTHCLTGHFTPCLVFRLYGTSWITFVERSISDK